MGASIELVRRAEDSRLVLLIGGALDVAAVAELREQGYSAVDRTSGQPVTFDLEAVDFIDSTGLGALLELRTYADEQGKSLVLVNVPDRVVHVITMTGLDAVFTLEAQR